MTNKLNEYEQRYEELKAAVWASRTALQKVSSLSPSVLGGAAAEDRTTAAFNVFHKLLTSEGIRPALYSVLRQSSYRYIGIFRFKDGKATSCVHVDREDLLALQAGEVPDTHTYCSYVRRQPVPFVTADAPADPRTEGHPARESVRSYYGLPLLDDKGAVLGTLCHYDLVPRDPMELDMALLLKVRDAVTQSGLIPPYPDLPAT